MTLCLTSSTNPIHNSMDKSIWEIEGITDDDYEMARYVGLSDPIVYDFDTMVEEEDENENIFNEDMDNFIEEIENAFEKGSYFYSKEEVIDSNKVYTVKIKVNKIWFNENNQTPIQTLSKSMDFAMKCYNKNLIKHYTPWRENLKK